MPMGSAASRNRTILSSRKIDYPVASSSTMSAVKSLVEKQIAENAVVVYSKSWCPYCRQAKQTLSEFGTSFQAYELDQIGMSLVQRCDWHVDNGEEIQAYLAQKTGQRTVPNIFIEQKHIGGNSDLQTLKSKGTLKNLVVSAGATSS